MKLPLDIFQLLGVTANADQKTILTVMERRLSECKFLGIGSSTLNKRRELLNSIGNTLLDKEKRSEYEKLYLENDLNLDNGFYDVPMGADVAAILLLLEANQFEECISLGERISNKWKLGVEINGTSYVDLMLVMDYASLSYSEELIRKRFYESAFSVINRRIRRVEDTRLKELQAVLVKELEDLKPFRILDLVSRSTTDSEHKLGKELLETMIRDSGGLEGYQSRSMNANEFKAFLRQIRSYLTVQEQIDLFKNWSMDQSPIASFLTSTALVASGFAQRKPERLVEALEVLNEINTKDLEVIKANIYLLLGEIDKGNGLLTEYADEDLQKWCESQSSTRLGQQCAWCEEWLVRDVIGGYRDLEADSDLEAYFGDRDVMEYIEKNDAQKDSDVLDSSEPKTWLTERPILAEKKAKKSNSYSPKGSGEKQKHKEEEDKGVWGLENRVITGLITFSICSLIGYGFIHATSRGKKPDEYQYKPTKIHHKTGINHVDIGLEGKKAEYHNFHEILSSWLEMKVKALREGALPRGINQFGTQKAVDILNKEVQDNQKDGIIRLVNVKVETVKVVRREDDRATIEATLEYREDLKDSTGRVVSTVNQHTFNKIYTLVKSGTRWLVE